jgi:hypothetical protein
VAAWCCCVRVTGKGKALLVQLSGAASADAAVVQLYMTLLHSRVWSSMS